MKMEPTRAGPGQHFAEAGPRLDGSTIEPRLRQARGSVHALREANIRLSRQQAALSSLTRLDLGEVADIHDAFRTVTAACAGGLNVARVSIWRFTPDREALACDCLYVAAAANERGETLERARHQGYFAALESDAVIDAGDARRDPRTRAFQTDYLEPLGIGAMLDAPIHVGGRVAGVLCHAHVGPPRAWTPDELGFAIAAANLVSLALAHEGRLEAERQLRRQAMLIDQAQDAIIVRTLDHRVQFWSRGAARLYGWSAEEMAGQNIAERLYEDLSARHLAVSQFHAAGEWAGELVHRTRDGRLITVFSRWSLLRGEADEPDQVLVISTDITERVQLEKRFLRAQRLESIGTLAGGIAHDLNNVLSPIIMAGNLLRLSEPDPARQGTLDTLVSSAQRGADMVRQVLSFARGIDGSRVAMEVAPLVRAVARIAEETFLKSIQVDLRLWPTLWPVIGDATQLHQVLMNLCVNARDAMPEGGRLTLSARNKTLGPDLLDPAGGLPAGAYVLIQVEDTGVGMPPEVRERIFEPFFTTKPVGRGTGLGLSTSHGIIKSHQGHIRVYSEPGRGTTFRIYLPAAVEAQACSSPAADRQEMPHGHGELVLVVDDESAIREVTQHALEAFGYRVLTAPGGAEALALYDGQGGEIALVVTDMAMPGMDGPATIAALRRIQPAVRVVASSGLNTHNQILHTEGLGVTHFLGKPFDVRELLTVVRAALDEGDTATNT